MDKINELLNSSSLIMEVMKESMDKNSVNIFSNDKLVSEEATKNTMEILARVKTLRTILNDMNTHLNALETSGTKILKDYKLQLIETAKNISWADYPVDEELPVTPEKNTAKKVVLTKTSVASPQSPATCVFSVFSKTDDGVDWRRIQIPLTKVCIGENCFIKLPFVSTDSQLDMLPAGMIVYHRGRKVPKFILTTGSAWRIEVPVKCFMYNYNDDTRSKKYSKFNVKINTNTDESTAHNYYIDEYTARKLGVSEDSYRVFRPQPHTDAQYRGWRGYNVYEEPMFGDSDYLSRQFGQVHVDKASDLYQFALWNMVVAMSHSSSASSKNKK